MKGLTIKFTPRWKKFQEAFDRKPSMSWADQKQLIEIIFNHECPFAINWPRLWKEHNDWFIVVSMKKGSVLWSEQKRQIETLIIHQSHEFNKNVWAVVYKDNKGDVKVFKDELTYEKAEKTLEKIAGDKNGVGGYDNVYDAVIVNLNSLF